MKMNVLLKNKRFWLVCVLLSALMPVIVIAQDSKQDEKDKKKDAPASLDDLLGLDRDEDEAKAGDAARKQSQRELQRRLDEKEITDAFLVAINRMASSAERLDELFDPGLATQRIQEDILAKLDQLIDKAQSMNSQSSSSSSSSSSQQSSMKPGQQSGSSQSNGDRKDGQAQDSQQGGPPARQEGDINTLLQQGAIEWGNLPQRLREELQQGRGDEYSSMYRKLTDEYYKRLAEEGSR